VSRRSFLESATLAAAATAILQGRDFLGSRGWLSSYQGVSDGRAEFRGYFRNRHQA
jgi:hypothetical protein